MHATRPPLGGHGLRSGTFHRKEWGSRSLPFAQAIEHCGPEAAESVLHAPPKIDRRGIRCVSRRTGYLTDLESHPDRLRQHLVVEDEIVRVRVEREPKEQLARKGTVPRVKLRQLAADQDVVRRREEPV